MAYSINLWIAFVFAAGAILFVGGNRRQAMAFALVAAVILPAAFLPLGHAYPFQPPQGHYTVLGARIDVDEAIWVLLDSGEGPPRYYRIPYTPLTANGLQRAIDMAAGTGGTVGAMIDGAGSPGFAEEGGAASEEPKQPEQAIIN